MARTSYAYDMQTAGAENTLHLLCTSRNIVTDLVWKRKVIAVTVLDNEKPKC